MTNNRDFTKDMQFDVLSGFLSGLTLNGALIDFELEYINGSLIILIAGERRSYSQEVIAQIQREVIKNHGH